MKCPKCSDKLKAHINKYQDVSRDDYIEVEILCENDEYQHCYFVRIKEEDLVEC